LDDTVTFENPPRLLVAGFFAAMPFRITIPAPNAITPVEREQDPLVMSPVQNAFESRLLALAAATGGKDLHSSLWVAKLAA